jgi:hypothetical protein
LEFLEQKRKNMTDTQPTPPRVTTRPRRERKPRRSERPRCTVLDARGKPCNAHVLCFRDPITQTIVTCEACHKHAKGIPESLASNPDFIAAQAELAEIHKTLTLGLPEGFDELHEQAFGDFGAALDLDAIPAFDPTDLIKMCEPLDLTALEAFEAPDFAMLDEPVASAPRRRGRKA